MRNPNFFCAQNKKIFLSTMNLCPSLCAPRKTRWTEELPVVMPASFPRKNAVVERWPALPETQHPYLLVLNSPPQLAYLRHWQKAKLWRFYWTSTDIPLGMQFKEISWYIWKYKLHSHRKSQLWESLHHFMTLIISSCDSQMQYLNL